ncbi:MAG: amino-acid N-acetyltransferase, partial [Gammaproteobacteria bacterium]|nr:amino-acid N-acetyltransferase [Gammaproteobacteria bacterium]
MSDNLSEFVKWFRSAAPYIHAHRGKTVVLQFDGDLIDSEAFAHLVHDIALLNSLGIRLIIVFGARPQIEKLQQQRNIESRLVRGLRLTDAASIACVKEAVGAARIQIEALLSMGLANSPMEDAQLKVTSGNFITAKPIGVIDGIDLGFTGEVRRIDTETMMRKLDNNEIVLIPPIGYSPTGEVFNLRATEVAMKIAISLAADKLLYLTPNIGLQDDAGEDIHQLTQVEAETLIDKSNLDELSHLQLSCGISACNEGVKRVHFLQQNQDGSLLLELFSRDGVGTLLSAASFDQIRTASIDDVGGILELIQPLEQEGVLVRRSREKIEAAIDDYTVLVRDGSVIACAALHIEKDSKHAELACLAVDENYQKSGKGEELFLNIEEQAIKQGVEKLFILTTQTAHWFLERGFIEADVNELPVAKQELYNYQRNSK